MHKLSGRDLQVNRGKEWITYQNIELHTFCKGMIDSPGVMKGRGRAGEKEEDNPLSIYHKIA